MAGEPMNPPDERLLFRLWLVIIVVILGALCVFYLGKSNAQVKKRVFHWYLGIGGLLVLLWFWLLGGPVAFLLGIPLYVVSVLIALKTTRFCQVCWPHDVESIHQSALLSTLQR
jgi:hypothetical protein